MRNGKGSSRPFSCPVPIAPIRRGTRSSTFLLPGVCVPFFLPPFHLSGTAIEEDSMRDQGSIRNFIHCTNVFVTTITVTLAAVAMIVLLAQPAQTQTYSVIYNLTTGTDSLGYEGG